MINNNNNNRRRTFRPRPQKSNFRRRNDHSNSNNGSSFNNGNMNFNRNASMTNPHNVEKTVQKFQQLAKDAQTAGDPVLVENYLQHADHYSRRLAELNERSRINTNVNQNNNPIETPVKETPVKETPVKETPVKETPVKDISKN